MNGQFHYNEWLQACLFSAVCLSCVLPFYTGTFGACDEIYQVACGAVTTQFTSVCVTCVRAFEVFRFVHFWTVATFGFVSVFNWVCISFATYATV